MGLFDTVFVDEEISRKLGFSCKKCGEYAGEFQTKDLGCGMDNYALLQLDGEIKLVRYLGPKAEYWVTWTAEEKREQEEARKGTWMNFLTVEDGYFKSEAHDLENQDFECVCKEGAKILEVYETCCTESIPFSREKQYVFVEAYLKLVDGAVVEVRREPGNWKNRTYLGGDAPDEPEPLL